MSRSLAAMVGGAIGALAFLMIVIWFLWYCIFHRRILANRSSETGSSDPPTTVEWSRGGRISSAGGGHATEHQGARQFTFEELSQATNNFDECNLVGSGSFGLVYNGLLLDGTIVAIKRRRGAPRQEFVEGVKKLSEICHRNLVTLIGYCQEGGLQMIVFEHLPNGSISRHLYDGARDPLARLEFKQRLSVAIGAAKGLAHLHNLVPQVVHKDFKSSNVLVDENFIAKVADAGIAQLLQRLEDAGPSQSFGGNVFQDPELSPKGQEIRLIAPDPTNFDPATLQQVEAHLISNDLIDQRLGSSFTPEGMKDLIRLTLQCLNPFGRKRPKMSAVVADLDLILETEMTLTTIMGDGTAIVTLGSQLFTSS
ncbi:putative Receptor-like protein kinase THESEUS 1 [Cocos nucifera]|nr:putative Receptor-like protein kinase THESEUS 1 [Cocos nucifera]